MMEEWIILVPIVFLASFLQTSTGYGFSIIGTPFLLLAFSAHTAIQINIILSLCLSILTVFKVREEVDVHLLVRLIKGSILGLISGIFIYLYLNIQLLKISMGALIILLTIMLLLNITISQTKRSDYFAGGFSGLLTTSIGVPGPPLLLYFSGIGIDKETLRSTTLTYYLFVYFISLIMQILFGGTSREVWILSFAALPPLFIGILFGQLLFKKINQKTFRIITYIILLFTGGYLLVTSLYDYYL